MIRRKYGHSLTRGSYTGADEDVNPMGYITNLADCMLIVAVGLLVALVTLYNVDLSDPKDQLTGTEVVMDTDHDGQVDEKYKETGTVYKDPDTGTYYLVQK